jgi:hypothetical protein
MLPFEKRKEADNPQSPINQDKIFGEFTETKGREKL